MSGISSDCQCKCSSVYASDETLRWRRYPASRRSFPSSGAECPAGWDIYIPTQPGGSETAYELHSARLEHREAPRPSTGKERFPGSRPEEPLRSESAVDLPPRTMLRSQPARRRALEIAWKAHPPPRGIWEDSRLVTCVSCLSVKRVV